MSIGFRALSGEVCLSACEVSAGDHQVIACGINRQESSTIGTIGLSCVHES